VSMFKNEKMCTKRSLKGGEIYVLYKGENPYQLRDLTNFFIGFVIFQLIIL